MFHPWDLVLWIELTDIIDQSQCHTMILKIFHTARPVKSTRLHLPVEENSRLLHWSWRSDVLVLAVSVYVCLTDVIMIYLIFSLWLLILNKGFILHSNSQGTFFCEIASLHSTHYQKKVEKIESLTWALLSRSVASRKGSSDPLCWVAQTQTRIIALSWIHGARITIKFCQALK